MDEKLLRKLSRQIRFLNIFMAFFGIVIITGLVIIGLLLWQVITFAQDINNRITNTREQLNVQQQACESDNRLGEFLRNNSDVCHGGGK